MASQLCSRRPTPARPPRAVLAAVLLMLGAVLGMHSLDHHAVAEHAGWVGPAQVSAGHPDTGSGDDASAGGATRAASLERGTPVGAGLAGACLGLLGGLLIGLRPRHVLAWRAGLRVLGLDGTAAIRWLADAPGPRPPRLVALSVCRC